MKRHNFLFIMILSCIIILPVSASADSPALIRERIEWCNIWITNAERDDLPRVLFIGDSITQGYFSPTEKLIGDRANCARLTTSRSVCDPILFDELSLILKQYDFAVIQFNNGLHGWGYTEEQYREGLEKMLKLLMKKAPAAKLVWASSTPVQPDSGMKDNAHRVALRNRIASDIVAKKSIPVDDLYSLAEGHKEYYSKDGVHFNDDGKEVQSEQVAEMVLGLLGKK